VRCESSVPIDSGDICREVAVDQESYPVLSMSLWRTFWRNIRSISVSKVTAFGITSVAIGIALIFAGLYFEEGPGGANRSYGAIIFFKLLDHLGVAAISIGLVGMILELHDWQRYFQDQLANTIMNSSYLDKMSNDQLMELRTKVLKARFKNKNLEREGGFLRHFDEKLHSLIGAPYREMVDMNLCFNPSGDDRLFELEESVSYTCRKMGEHIQNEVSWGTFMEYELDHLKSFEVEVRVPDNFFQSPDFKTKFPKGLEPIIRVKAPIEQAGPTEDGATSSVNGIGQTLQESLKPWPNHRGFTLPLDVFGEVDGLYVNVKVKYTIPTNSLLTWTMTHTSKGVRCMIRYPDQYDIQLDYFGMDSNQRDVQQYKGTSAIKYMSWILPNDGIAFHFVKRAAN
jgi:hypothetical protein